MPRRIGLKRRSLRVKSKRGGLPKYEGGLMGDTKLIEAATRAARKLHGAADRLQGVHLLLARELDDEARRLKAAIGCAMNACVEVATQAEEAG